MPINELDDLITQAEAARLRNVTREAIYGLVARGKLHVVRIGGQKFVRRSEVETYIPESGGRPPSTQKLSTALRKAPRKARHTSRKREEK